MPKFGAHMSVAGGVDKAFAQAIERVEFKTNRFKFFSFKNSSFQQGIN